MVFKWNEEIVSKSNILNCMQYRNISDKIVLMAHNIRNNLNALTSHRNEQRVFYMKTFNFCISKINLFVYVNLRNEK